MKNDVLFIQGGGDGGYQADKELVVSLQHALGKEYKINYPEIQSDESKPDFGWVSQIAKQFTRSTQRYLWLHIPSQHP